MHDYRYTLDDIREAWSRCQACDLGVRRSAVGGEFVFGEGTPGGIMFVGEGPGGDEEIEGRPFVGKSGAILRAVIEKLGLSGCSYITNAVACRSCSQAYNSEGQPIHRFDRKRRVHVPVIKDEAPTPLQIATCMPRLHYEIYLVDPKLIVALGGEAAKALSSKRSFGILSERGKLQEISIPGAWHLPSLTEKKEIWRRKVHGEYTMPSKPNRVQYSMLPTLHPAYVLRRQADQSYKNPLDVFLADMKLAAAIYDRYQREAFGITAQERDVSINDLAELEQ